MIGVDLAAWFGKFVKIVWKEPTFFSISSFSEDAKFFWMVISLHLHSHIDYRRRKKRGGWVINTVRVFVASVQIIVILIK